MFNQCTLRPAKGRRFLANAVSVLQWLDMAGRDFASTVSVLHRLVKAQLASKAPPQGWVAPLASCEISQRLLSILFASRIFNACRLQQVHLEFYIVSQMLIDDLQAWLVSHINLLKF